LSGFGSSLVSESVNTDIHGNETVSTTTLDSVNKRRTTIVDSSDATNDQTSVSEYGLLVSNTTKSGMTISYEYDALGRRTGIVDPRIGRSITHYNDDGRVDYVEDAAGNRTGFGYDAETGRKIWEKNAFDKFTRYLYNDRGQVTHFWGEAVYPVRYVYDSYGQRTHMYTYQGGTGWDSDIWPADTGVADATTWHYDEATGLLSAKEDAAGKVVSYSYTAANQLETRTWARLVAGNQLSTTYIYDTVTAELTDIDYSDATVDISFSYDRMGRQQTISDGLGARTFSYNNTLQLDTETITGLYNKTISRNYDTIGRNSGFTVDADYAATYGYDSTTGRFASISWDVGGVVGSASYGYLSNSNLLQTATFSSGQLTTYGYEPHRNLKTQVRNDYNGILISQYDYKYDAIGRRAKVANSGNAFTANGFNIYSYNDKNELTDSDRYLGTDVTDISQPVNNENRGYGYDNIGNRKNATDWDETQNVQEQLTYTANQLNQYDLISSSAGPDKTPVYDDDGNMTSYGDTVYTYNAENRLIAVEPLVPNDNDTRVEFTYDYLGRRINKKIYTYSAGSWLPTSDFSYLYDGWNLIAKLDATGQPTVSYVWGLDLSQSMQGAGGIGGLLYRVEDGTGFTYTYDANGNVGQIVDNGGFIAAHYEYDPYGNAIKAVGTLAEINPYRFSTKHFDIETGLYYYGNRYYSPELGRWINRDPIEEEGGLNLDNFVGNNSIGRIDPFGLALYAFDGTWNTPSDETNVWKLFTAYGAKKVYLKGVGTNWYTKHIGGATGAGGRNRLEVMYRELITIYNTPGNKENKTIDIIGFSRGAALAREFANMLDKRGVPPTQKFPMTEKGCPVTIRFLGLFDTVGSFGVPGNSVNIGYNLSIPNNVENVRHAVAADEKRGMFPLTSVLSTASPPWDPIQSRRIQEAEFPGAHSDVGGGYRDGDLSDRPLKWMWREGRNVGVPFGNLNTDDMWVTNPVVHDERGWWERFRNKDRKIYYLK